MEMSILSPMIAIAILFIVAVTSLWKTSISTAVHAVSVATAIYCFPMYGASVIVWVLFAGVLFNMLRAVVNTDEDQFVKRTSPLT